MVEGTILVKCNSKGFNGLIQRKFIVPVIVEKAVEFCRS